MVRFIGSIYPITDIAVEARFPPALASTATTSTAIATAVQWLLDIKFEEALDFSDVTSKSRQSATVEFKTGLKMAYGQPSDFQEPLFDMATGHKLPHSTVVASHIFQRRWANYLSIFTKMTDIDDVRNGLLLYKPVEWAFDRAKLCVEVRGDCMSFFLLDRELENIKLTDKAKELRLDSQRPGAFSKAEAGLGEITFGDLDGSPVHIPPNHHINPARRLLSLHAQASWIRACKYSNGYEIRRPIHTKSIIGDISGDEKTAQVLDYIVNRWKSGIINEDSAKTPLSSRESLTTGE
jgi:hypothetical protein